jgi:hypothetical protein
LKGGGVYWRGGGVFSKRGTAVWESGGTFLSPLKASVCH